MPESLNISSEISLDKLAAAESSYRFLVPILAEVRRQEVYNLVDGRKYKQIIVKVLYFISFTCVVLFLNTLIRNGFFCTDLIYYLVLVVFVFLTTYYIKNEETALLGLHRFTANLSADKIFSISKKLAPFVSNYDFDELNVTYFREKEGVSVKNWFICISGKYYINDHFLLVFSKKSFYPTALIFVNEKDKLIEYLNKLGLSELQLK